MTQLKITVLGCGGSGGVPLTCGWWGDCNPQNPKNRRRRASLAVQSDTTTLIVDTGPDFREQTLENNITRVDAVLYTHAHADHVNGMDELRYLSLRQQMLIPIYADQATLDEQYRRFDHLLMNSADGFYKTCLEPHVLLPYATQKHGDIDFLSIPQKHGVYGASLGFRFGNFAYSTDVSGLEQQALEALHGIDTWLVDCGQYKSDFVAIHPNFDMVQAWNETVQAKNLILMHLTPRIDYDVMNAETPDNTQAAYDGMILSALI